MREPNRRKLYAFSRLRHALDGALGHLMIAFASVLLVLSAPDGSPDQSTDPTAEVVEGLPAPEPPALVDAGPGPDMELGLEIGEPTGLIFAKMLNPAGRLTARLGLLHRVDPYLFGLDAPVFGVGYEHDLLRVPVPGWQAHLTGGTGALLWVRGAYHRTQPMLALEARVGLRLRRPNSPLTIAAHLSPQMDLVPYQTPAVVGGLSFTWDLGAALGGGTTQPPAPVDDEAKPDEPKSEPKAAEKPKKRSKSKARKPKKRR